MPAVWATLALTRSPIRPVADRRLGARYDDAELTAAVFSPERRELVLSTKGGGVHTIDVHSGFLRQHTRESTGGRLLAATVWRIDRGRDGHLYYLGGPDDGKGLCSSDPSLGAWRTLLGVVRFPPLKSLEQVTAVLGVEGRLWVATGHAGIGVYDPRTHAWETIHRAGADGLLDDRVRDLLADPHGNVWVATDAGLNRARGGRWERFVAPDRLVGSEVRRLYWRHGALWYVTQGGGLGRYDGSAWQTLAGETRWGNRGDADVALACHDFPRDQLWFIAHDSATGRYDRRTGADPFRRGQRLGPGGRRLGAPARRRHVPGRTRGPQGGDARHGGPVVAVRRQGDPPLRPENAALG